MQLGLEPDATQTVRVYVIAPPDTPPQPLRFRLKSLDKEGASDESQVQFAAPGSEGS
jgi:hypothetical protein